MFVNLAIYMVPMMFQIFLPCYYGNEIILKSKNLSNDYFHSDWFNESRKSRNSAKIMMEFVKKPVKIRVIGIFDVDLTTFMRICNSAYTLFAVFKRIS